MLLNFFTFSQIEISGAVVVFNIVLSVLVCFVIAFTHKRTHSGLSYSNTFFATLVLIGVVGTVIMMVVQNNIFGALGLLGAFTLIRFRTIIKETRDIAFVFFALAEGVAVGLAHYAIAIISTPLICFVAYILVRYNIGSLARNKFIVMLSTSSPLREDSLRDIFKKNGITLTLLNSKKKHDNSFEYILSARDKNMSNINKLLDEESHHYAIVKYEVISDQEPIGY